MDLRQQAHEELDIKYSRRLIARRRFKYFLIILNIFLVCYSTFFITLSVIDNVKNYLVRGTEVENYIKLCNKNAKGSQDIYAKYLKNDQDIYINDYIFIGENLTLSEYDLRISNPVLSGSKIKLSNVCKRTEYQFNTSQLVNQNIDLRNLETGDYLLELIKSDGPNANLRSNLDLFESIYLLPRHGIRHKVTLSSNKYNPGIVISVEKVSKLPSGYADIYIDQEKVPAISTVDKIKNLNQDLVVTYNSHNKGLSNTQRLKEIIPSQARYLISLDDDNKLESNIQILISDKINNHFKSSQYTVKVDLNNQMLKQAGGVSTNAGSCQIDIEDSCDLVSYRQYFRQVSETYIFIIQPDIFKDDTFTLLETSFVNDFYLNVINRGLMV